MNTKEKLELLDEVEDGSWEKLKNFRPMGDIDERFLDRIIKIQAIRKELNK